ncbi:protein NDR1-like [Cornus florida]|uniref:protein NDR1-like n=1 Tax=Cornus florida TaxID=4283 RepID=UPI00289EFBAE|nr:protein NDR1-like [Cornus florida]
MTDSRNAGCCRCCCSFVLTSGLTALFMWLSLRTTHPTCSIQDFYLPALQNTTPNYNSTNSTNTTIYFDLKLDNKNKDKGIHYDALNLTIYYGENQSHPVANKTIPGFYQGHKKKAHRKESVNTYGVPWAAISSNGTAFFRVDLSTKVRFKIMFWNTKRDKIIVWAPVEVNATGHKVYKKGIKLKSGAPDLDCYRARVVLLLAVVSVLFLTI